MPENDTWALIEKRMNALKPLHSRMDRTRDQLYMEDFQLLGFDGKAALKNVINVTSNAPSVFADAIKADLMTAKWQTVVEGDISQEIKQNIVQFVDASFEQADEFLLNRFGLTSLKSWLASHVCIRSFIGVRWLVTEKDGELQIDCLPVDMRWTPHQYDKDGLAWVAPISFRNMDDLKLEYPNKELRAGKGGGEEINDSEVRDYWSRKVNELWINEGKVVSGPNSSGKPPFVIASPPTGFSLRDKGFLEHEAEDIFFNNSKLYNEWNRTLSVEQTYNMRQLYPAYEREFEVLDGKPAQPAPKAGQVGKVKKGERAQVVETGDMNRGSAQARQDVKDAIAVGGASDAELGSSQLDRPGIWFTRQFEIRQKLEAPRLEALQIMRQGLAELNIEQFINGGMGELMVGKTGSKNKFSADMLGNPSKYRITSRFMISSKTQETVNLAQAQSAIGILPLSVIHRDILNVEDPAGLMRELALEKAKANDASIELIEMAFRYVDEAEQIKDEAEKDLKLLQSKRLFEQAVATIKASRQLLQNPEIDQPQASRSVLSGALSEGNGAGGNGQEVLP
ncbi:hypothetical protein LCGC14_0651350 [marine sediment metagenome]|uniref:Portal protein n=1 Tax=marine sediment metagenome TaxID=412755 RepID=A0A0F9QW55_9ZZZZ